MLSPAGGHRAHGGRVARTAVLAGAAAITAATAFDTGFSSRLGPGLLPYLAAVGDVAHGRTPLVDTASRGGWGAIDLLGAIFASVPLGYGTLALAVSAAAAICALLVLTLATSVVRSLAAAVLIAGAAVAVGALGGPVPDAGAPSSGALTLLIPLLGAVAVVRGADGSGWRPVALLSCVFGVLWSAPAAVLTIVTIAAGLGGWPADVRHTYGRRCAIAASAGLVAYLIAGVARSGALPDPRVLLAANPLAPSAGEPAATAASNVLGLLSLVGLCLAWWAWRSTRVTATARSVSAVRAIGALAAALAVHGLAGGAPVQIAHAAGLALLLVGIVAHHHGVRGTLVFVAAVAAVCACVGGTIAARWQTSALYAVLPHEPLAALGAGNDTFDQSLRYNLRVLAGRPLVSPDAIIRVEPLLSSATRRGDRWLVLLPGLEQAELLALLDGAAILPIGDPTTNDVVGRLRTRLREAIGALPRNSRIITREDWLMEAGTASTGVHDEPTPLQALRLLLASFDAHVLVRASGVVVANLHRRSTLHL